MNNQSTYIYRLMLRSTAMLILIFLTVGAMEVYSEPARALVGTGRTLKNVRVQILSVDDSTGIAQVKFSGEGCNYCDDTYQVDQTTQIHTLDYRGSMDLVLLKDRVFMRGFARVILADKTVQEVRYVEIDE